jgi:hypothetical protein
VKGQQIEIDTGCSADLLCGGHGKNAKKPQIKADKVFLLQENIEMRYNQEPKGTLSFQILKKISKREQDAPTTLRVAYNGD